MRHRGLPPHGLRRSRLGRPSEGIRDGSAPWGKRVRGQRVRGRRVRGRRAVGGPGGRDRRRGGAGRGCDLAGTPATRLTGP
nr:hypothetical protein [Streptomyces aurantiacus]